MLNQLADFINLRFEAPKARTDMPQCLKVFGTC